MKNFNEFIKELENQMHVKFSTSGERRLSIGKRKPSEDSNLESASKRAPDSKLVKPSQRRKNRTPTKTLDIHVFNKQ